METIPIWVATSVTQRHGCMLINCLETDLQPHAHHCRRFSSKLEIIDFFTIIPVVFNLKCQNLSFLGGYITPESQGDGLILENEPIGPIFLVLIGHTLWVLECTILNWEQTFAGTVTLWIIHGTADKGPIQGAGLLLDTRPMAPIFPARIGQTLWVLDCAVPYWDAAICSYSSLNHLWCIRPSVGQGLDFRWWSSTG